MSIERILINYLNKTSINYLNKTSINYLNKTSINYLNKLKKNKKNYLIINIMVKRKKMKGGQDTPVLTKVEVLQDPKIQEALKAWSIQQGGGAMRQFGSGWWSDFVGWLKRNKVISIASKIGSAIAGATGFVPLATALGAVSTGASALGYGRKVRISRPRILGRGATPIAYNTPSSDTPILKW